MTEISDELKVKLLFKEFTGVVNAKQQSAFPQEEYSFKDYILNNNILSDNIPTILPSGWRSSDLDASSNILDNTVTNLSAIGLPQLAFHKKRTLQPATFGSLKTWFITDGSGGSLLKNALSFKTDPINNSYIYSVYRTFPNFFFPINMYATPTFWLFDFKSGFLEFYCDENTLNSNNPTTGGIDLSNNPPVISFFQYVGATGGGGGGGGGDASYNNIEVQGNNLMQSVTIQPWSEPVPVTTNPLTYLVNYVIATVDISGNSEMPLGYFTLQLGDPYKQLISFYAGVIENKGAFIKIISCTNENGLNAGFKNLKIISYDGTCYLVSTFWNGVLGKDPDLLKIILVNNNANRDDNPTNNPDWILRNNPDEDWLPGGPEPPETKMPWTVGSPTGSVPPFPPALVTVSLLQNGGMPYGVSTQPEYFQNNIVLDTSANILAGENGTGTIDICGGLYVDRDASFNMDVHVRSSVDIGDKLSALLVFAKDISAGNHIYSNEYRGHSNGINTPLILDASYNDYCSFNIKHQRGDISIGKKSEQTGWTIQSIDGIHMLTDSARMNPISVTEKTLDMSDNDIINIRTLGVQDIYSHGSLLLDYSSVEITTPVSTSTNYYDIAFVGTDVFNLNNVPIFQCKSASAMFEIYIVKKIDGLTQSNSFNNIFSYVKFQASVFRQQAASIEILNGFNINAAQAYIKSLRIKYRSGTNFVFDDPGGLLQIGLARGLGIGDGTAISMYCRISQNNFEQKQQAAAPSAFQYLNSTWKMSLSNSINNYPTYDTFQSGGAALPNQSFSKTREVLCDFNPNIGTTASTAPFGDGLMFSINDKDTKFTSNCRFEEDVDFSGNIGVTGLINAFGNINMNGTNITNASNLTVRGNGSSGIYRTKVDWLDVSRNIVVHSPLDNAAGPVFEARGVPDSSENTIVMRGWLNSSNSNQESIVATVGRNNNNVGSGFNWFYINPNQSDRIRLTVGTPNAGGTEGGFSVGTSNNIKCNVGLSLYKDTKTNLDSGSKSLDVGAIGIMEDVGINVTTTGQKRADALFWKASIANSTSNPRLIINEMKSRIYNNRLCSGYTNNSNYRGGIDDTSFSFMQSGGKEYAYFTTNGSPSGRYSYFGMGPALIQQAYSSAAEAINTNKGFLLRDTWITGIFLNTPFVHVRKDPSSNIQSNMNGALFGFEQNSGTYIEVQIGSNASSGGGGQYTTVYRFGATSFGSSVVLDETSFPSSPEGFFDGNSSTTQKGLRIVLDSKDWVYVPAGKNMDHIVRFKYNIKAAHSGGTPTSRVLMVLDEKVGPTNGPTYCESKLEGYVTYVQYPVA